MVNRGRIFLVSLDVNTGSVRSIAIDITKKVTEFVVEKKGGRNAPIEGERHSLHSSLLDCHTEVWTRFPLIPAVRRRTVTSLSERHQKRLTFVTDNYTRPFDSYFSDLVQTFERTTRKPTGGELRRIKVSAEQFGTFQDNVAFHSEWKVSRYRTGEWLVDLLCLIPIHIAVCRENRFIPLADGVLSSDLERTLLGAEVNQIVDKLSFGWYESIFRSYLATKVCLHPFLSYIPKNVDAWRTAGKGCIIHGPAICGQEFLPESSSRYIVCGQCYADHRYGLRPTYRTSLIKESQRVYGCQ
jgi:hypothetical protein